MSVSRRGVDVLMDCCRPPVVAGLPLQQKDPGTCGLRGPRVVRLVGGTQHHVLCAANRSLLDSCDSCGNARGRLARRPRFERFVTLLYHCHLYLAFAVSSMRSRGRVSGRTWWELGSRVQRSPQHASACLCGYRLRLSRDHVQHFASTRHGFTRHARPVRATRALLHALSASIRPDRVPSPPKPLWE